MKSWKVELGALGGVILCSLGIGTSLLTAEGEPPAAAQRQFTQADYAAFDRNFELDGEHCVVGRAALRLCFSHSPLSREIEPGAPLPRHLPAMPAEVGTLLALSPKDNGLATYRYGRTLVLIEKESEHVADRIDLGAPSYAAARGNDQYARLQARPGAAR